MKYVRTNYGIYETEKYCEIRKVINIDGTFYLIINVEGIYEKIIKEADNLEELIDELVLKDLDTNFCFVMNANHIKDIKDNLQNLMDNEYLKNHIIYGAIWTDKGLIYVAKINKDGELKLI